MPHDPTSTDGSKQPTKSARNVQRRSILKGVLGAGSTSTLAGCFGDGDDSPSATGTRGTGADPTATASAAQTDSPTESASPTSVSQVGPPDNVVVVSPDGDLQAALEDVAGRGSYGSTPWGVVRLQAGEQYDIEETIEMPGYCSLDFNGARMTPTGNFDVIDASASSHLNRPYIDVQNVSGYDSTIIKVTTRVKKVESFDPVYIDRMYLHGGDGASTGVQCIDDQAEGMWAVHMSGIIISNEVGLHLRAEGDGSWVNSCSFDGIMKGPTTGVLTERLDGAVDCTAHELDVIFQPSDSEWFWDLQQGRGITAFAATWDSHEVADETFWHIGEEAGFNNKFIDTMGGGTWEDDVEENKIGGAPNGAAGNTYFTHNEAMNHLDRFRQLDDLEERVADIESQLE